MSNYEQRGVDQVVVVRRRITPLGWRYYVSYDDGDTGYNKWVWWWSLNRYDS